MRFITLLTFLLINLYSYGDIAYSQRKNVVTESDSLYGFIYKGLVNVIPQYSQTVALGNNRPCFLAKSVTTDKWGLVDIYNRPLIPFIFSDIKIDSEINPQKKRNINLDSIYVADRGTVLPPISLSYNPEYHKFTDNTPAILVVKGMNPETNAEEWRFIDFSGEAITPIYYDFATEFKIYKDKKNKNSIYLANVKRNNLWGAIDLNGNEVIPPKYKSPINSKNKDLKKLLKKDHTSSDNSRKEELEKLVPEEGINTSLWLDDSFDSIRIEKIGGEIIKPKTKGKRKSRRKSKPQYTPVQYRIYINDSIAFDENFDEVAPQQNDMVRVRKNDKWGIYRANMGMFLPCEFSSIEPFDQFGITTCTIDSLEIKVSAYGAYANFGPDLEDIFYRANQSYQKTKDLTATGPIFEEILDALSFYEDPRLRLSYQSYQMNEYFSQKREREDPVYAQYMQNLREQKRIEEERERLAREAKEKEKKSSGGFWGMLGELASIAGDVIETTGSITGKSATSELGGSLSYLGKSVEAAAKGTEMPVAPSSDTSVASAISETQSPDGAYSDTSEIENQIRNIDERIKENRNRAAALAQQRPKNQSQIRKDMYYATGRTRNVDITKNNPYSSARRKAAGKASASVKSRNQLTSINSQLDRLEQEFRNLTAQRNALTKKLDNTSDYDEANDGTSTSKKKKSKEEYQKEYDYHAERAESLYQSLTATGYSVKKDGKDTEGSGNKGRGFSSHSRLAEQYVRHQTKMRHIRQNAAAHKYILNKSEYETAKVSW